MARYIDADLLIKKIFPLGMIDDGNFPVNAKAVKVTIDKLSTADVAEVVRCKDCRYCELIYPEKELNKEPTPVYYCKVYKCDKQPTDFCSYGKKKRAKNKKSTLIKSALSWMV